MPPDIELQPGQTAIVNITPRMQYRITHTGWVLDVVATKDIGVKPSGARSLSIVRLEQPEDDEIP